MFNGSSGASVAEGRRTVVVGAFVVRDRNGDPPEVVPLARCFVTRPLYHDLKSQTAPELCCLYLSSRRVADAPSGREDVVLREDDVVEKFTMASHQSSRMMIG